MTAEGVKAILKVAYERLGVNVTFSPLPRKRALKMSIIGQKDGEVIRRLSVAKQNPSLLAVQPPLIFSEVRAYYRKGEDLIIDDTSDLSDLTVIRVRGIVSHQLITDQAKGQIVAANYEQGVALLLAGRADALIGGELVHNYFNMAQGKGQTITSAILSKDPLYHMLHVRNSDLVPQLESILKEMDASGESDILFQARIDELLQSPNVN